MTQELNQYLQFLYGETEGYVYAPVKDSEGKFTTAFFEWPKQQQDIVDYVLRQSGSGNDVYCSPSLFKSAGSALKENIKGTNVVWAEFDGNADIAVSAMQGVSEGLEGQSGTRDQDHDQQASDDRTAPASAVPEPSMRVRSSLPGHEHVYWRLNEFTTDISSIEEINRSISYYYDSDHSGWDANQILRPPGTTNYKRNKQVEILDRTETSFSLDRFSKLPKAKELVRESLGNADIPPIGVALGNSKAWDQQYLDLLFNQQPLDRSGAIFKVAFYAAELGMSDAQIYSVIDYFDTRIGKFTNRSDRNRRLIDIVNKARTKYPRGIDALLDNPLLYAEQTNTKTVYGFSDFLATDVHIEWLVEGLLERSGYGIFSSAPGVGKTQLGIHLGICLATGQDFFSFKVVNKSGTRVLFLSLEMAHAPIKWFFEQRSKEDDVQNNMALLQENFMIAPVGSSLNFDSTEGRTFLENLITEYRPDTIIVDSLSATTVKSLTDDVGMRALFDYLQKVRQRYGISFIFIHHNRKANGDNKKPIDLSDVIGSVYITAPADFVFSLWPIDESSIAFRQVKARLGKIHKQLILARNSNLSFEVSEHTGTTVIEPLAKSVKEDSDEPTDTPPKFSNPFSQ